MSAILQKENKILRAAAIPVEDPSSQRIGAIIKRMAEAMFLEPDGIGIAAPQIGESIRVFLVAGDILTFGSAKPNTPEERKKEYFTFINPVIKKYARKKSKDIEGCLSVRGFYGEVLRSEKVTVEYWDERGKKHLRGASGLFARAIQHEMDHLNGALFIDKAENLKHIE